MACSSTMLTLVDALGGEGSFRRHSLWFQGLMFRPLAAEVESFHSQRLLLMYFAVVGGVALKAPWLMDGEAAVKVENELRRCYDVSSGGFAAEDLDLFATQPTLTLTHCAVYVLAAVGRLHSALASWLRGGSDIVRFVVSCSNKDDDDARAFAAHCRSREVDVRFSYSALMTLHLIVESALPAGDTTIEPLLRQQRCQEWLHVVAGLEEPAVFFQQVKRSILQCWSPLEGGFGGTHDAAECHGGMTYCATASLWLLGAWCDGCDAPSSAMRRQLIGYCVARVGCAGGHAPRETESESDDDGEGEVSAGVMGFCGRPNKPCDTCYTFWMGASLRIMEIVVSSESLIDDAAVAAFVTSCSGKNGGFGRDSRSVDPLHSALGVTGLACRLPCGADHGRVHPVLCRYAIAEGT